MKVVTIYDREPKEPYYILRQFHESLDRLGVQPEVLGNGKKWGGLMTKPRTLRKWLRKQPQHEQLIVCDAWDIVFVSHPEELIEKSEIMFPKSLVFNAEKNCFPRGDLADQFPDKGTPWRYLNSGFMVGRAGRILELLEGMGLDNIPDDHQRRDGSWFNPNDQEYYTLAFIQQPVRMALDTNCELCQSLSGCEPSEFDMTGDRIRNLVTGSEPGVFRFNGGSKQVMMPLVLAKLGL